MYLYEFLISLEKKLFIIHPLLFVGISNVFPIGNDREAHKWVMEGA